MKRIEKIIFNKKLYALILRSNYQKNGIEFLTPSKLSQQIALIKHKKGYTVTPHINKKIIYKIQTASEVLYIIKGKIKLDLFSSAQKFICSIILETGELISLVEGGHGIEILEDTKMIEIKQGPFINNKYKIQLFQNNKHKMEK
jgi:hypothetical protein